MLQLRLIRSGEAPRDIKVSRDVAVVGRSPDCDVCIDDSHISKNHARILRGVVVIDLGSTNGTWVNDVRITEPTLVTTRRFRIGTGDNVFEIELAPESAAVAAPPEPGLDATMVEYVARPPVAAPAAVATPATSPDERERAVRIARELEELKKQSEGQRAQASSALAEARLDILRLNQRLASLKSEVEARAQEGEEAVHARLLQTRIDEVEAKNGALRQRVSELEAAAGVPVAPPAPAPAQPMGEFVTRMQKELLRLQQENRELKEKASAKGDGGGAAAAIGAVPAGAAAVPASSMFAELQGEVRDLRRQKKALEDEVLQFRVAKASMNTAAPEPSAPAAPEIAPNAPAATSQNAPPGAGGGAVRLLPSLLGDDLEGMTTPLDATFDDFLLFVALRFLRGAEKVVAYTALEFIEVMDMRTMLPDAGVNFRGLAASLLAKPADPALRRKLDRYLGDLRRWLVAALGAYKTASKEFVRDLKKSLSAEALIADRPIPLLAKREVELWKRANALLAELTPDTMDDGIEKLARRAAQRTLEIGDDGGRHETRRE